jgi:hypothetical protein
LDVSYSYSPSFPRTKKTAILREEEEVKEQRYSYELVEKPDKEKQMQTYNQSLLKSLERKTLKPMVSEYNHV